jgi:hypothetical protein
MFFRGGHTVLLLCLGRYAFPNPATLPFAAYELPA